MAQPPTCKDLENERLKSLFPTCQVRLVRFDVRDHTKYTGIYMNHRKSDFVINHPRLGVWLPAEVGMLLAGNPQEGPDGV